MKVAKYLHGRGLLRIFVLMTLTLSGCLRSPDQKSAAFLEDGKKLLKQKDVTRAILQFRNAAQVSPRNPEIYFQLGEASIAARDFRSAVAAFRKVLELDPKHMEAQLRLAQMMAVTDDGNLLRDAESRLKELVQSGSPSHEMLNTLAFTQLKLGNIDYAIHSLERSLAQYPDALDSSVMLARAKLSKQDAAGAEAILKTARDEASNAPLANVVLGEFYVSQKRLSDAETQFKRALEIDGNSAQALLALARLQLTEGRKLDAERNFSRLASFDAYKGIHAIYLFQEGRHDDAIREFEQLAKRYPEDRQTRTNLLAVYRASNRTADADELLNAALQNNPKDAEALLVRGEISISEGNYSQAEADLNQVLRLNPGEPSVHYLLAKLSQARGATLTYRQELSVALGLNPKLEVVRLELAQSMLDNKAGARAAISLLDAAPESQRDSMALLVQRNWALWMLGEFAEMRKGIDRGLLHQRSLDLLIQDGLWRLRAGDPAGGRAALEEALKLNPADLRALQALNQTYLAQKNAPMALRTIKEFAARQPQSAPVQDFLGVVLMATGDRAQARKAFDIAKAMDPQFIKADLSLIQLDVADGKIDDARKRLYAFVSAHHSDATAQLWLGVVEQMKGNDSAAIELYRKVMELTPGNTQASNNLAYLLCETGGRLDEAQTYAEKAIESAPGKPAYLDTLGWILYRKGLYASAVKYLEQASSGQSNAVWQYHLAMAYFKAGDASRGRSVLGSALKLNPNLPEAKLARQVLGELN